MEALFWAVWFAVVIGIGGAAVFAGLSSKAKNAGNPALSRVIGVGGVVWLVGPILYALPQLLDDFGLLGIFGVLPAWSLGVESISKDMLGFSPGSAMGIPTEMHGGAGSLGLRHIFLAILGLVTVSILMGLRRLPFRNDDNKGR